MAVSLGFAIILGLSISFCSCYDFSISRDPYYKEVYQFVKHVIIDWNQKHLNDTNDISIINLDNDTSLYDIVRQAIPKENPILLPQKACKDITKYSKLRQSSLLILVSKVYGDINEYAAPIFQCIYSGFWTPLTNVIVVPPKNLQADVDVLYPGQVLTISRALNFIVPYIQNGKILGIYRGNILRGEFDTLERTTNTDVLFNDKLSDMHGYPYRTVIYVSDKRKFTNGTALISIEVKVANTMAMKQCTGSRNG